MVNLKLHSDILPGIQAVIFDKDGTLMDLYNYWFNMVNFRVELARKKFNFNEIQQAGIMYAMGVDLKNKRLRSQGPVGLKKREVVMQAMADALADLGFAADNHLCSEIFLEADRISLEHLAEIIRPINGLADLIGRLHSRGAKIAIATTDKTERAVLAMKILGISEKIDMVVGEDKVKNYKPYPDMLNLILRELSIDRQHAVMVGDALTDVEMGINAGLAASIGVCSGLTAKESLLEKTRYVIPDISYLKIV